LDFHKLALKVANSAYYHQSLTCVFKSKHHHIGIFLHFIFAISLDSSMNIRCQGCKDYKQRKRLPDFQVTFNNWCELRQTPCALIKTCNLYPDLLQNFPKSSKSPEKYILFNIFNKKTTESLSPFAKQS